MATKQQKAPQQKKSNDYFRSVKMLLKHYRRLKSYSGNMQTLVSRFEDLQGAFGLGEVEFPVALSKHQNKTVIFMEYVDSNLETYKTLCLNGTEEEKRRWKILYDMHLSEQSLTAAVVAEKYGLTETRPYKEVNKACGTLAVLFFGIDGIDGFLD